MPRTFACLAIGDLIVLIGTGVAGVLRLFSTPDVHIALGVFSLLVSCLIQVLVSTYLTVSGKVIAQAVHLGKLDADPLRRLAQRKRTNTRLVAAVVVSIVLVTATGASHWRARVWSIWHFGSALALLGAHLLALAWQYLLVADNSADLEATLAAYTDHRPATATAGGAARANE